MQPEHDQMQDNATVVKLLREEQSLEDQDSLDNEAPSAHSEPAGTTRQPTEEAAAQDADVLADSTSRADAPEPAGHRHKPVSAEAAEDSVGPSVAPANDRKTSRRSAARVPGSVGSVSIPRRLQAQQTPGKISDKDNQSPRRTS